MLNVKFNKTNTSSSNLQLLITKVQAKEKTFEIVSQTVNLACSLCVCICFYAGMHYVWAAEKKSFANGTYIIFDLKSVWPTRRPESCELMNGEAFSFAIQSAKTLCGQNQARAERQKEKVRRANIWHMWAVSIGIDFIIIDSIRYIMSCNTTTVASVTGPFNLQKRKKKKKPLMECNSLWHNCFAYAKSRIYRPKLLCGRLFAVATITQCNALPLSL